MEPTRNLDSSDDFSADTVKKVINHSNLMRISEPELERQRKHFREEAERLHNQSVEVIEAALHAAAGLGRIEYAKKLIAANRQIRALQAKLGKAKEIANKMVGKSENT